MNENELTNVRCSYVRCENLITRDRIQRNATTCSELCYNRAKTLRQIKRKNESQTSVDHGDDEIAKEIANLHAVVKDLRAEVNDLRAQLVEFTLGEKKYVHVVEDWHGRIPVDTSDDAWKI